MQATYRHSARGIAHLRSRCWGSAGGTAAALATLVTGLLTALGAVNTFEQRLSDAWFGLSDLAPSGRTVIVRIDDAAGAGPGPSRAQLTELLKRLDTAGVVRILLAVNLSRAAVESEDAELQRMLTQLGPQRVGVLVPAVLAGSGGNAYWTRIAVHDRFAPHVTLTASDLALDRDAQLRTHGIASTGLPVLPAAPHWLAGRDHQQGPPFRINYSVDLTRIPVIGAGALMEGNDQTRDLAGTSVIVGTQSSALGYGIRVPRYGEVKRVEITALASETLLLNAELRVVPALLCGLLLMLLAAGLGWWSMRLNIAATAGTFVGIALTAIGVSSALQTSFGVVVPSLAPMAAALFGLAAGQFARELSRRKLEQRRTIDELQQIATRDPLTGLANRRSFERALASACGSADTSFALLLCDLDGFKPINDTLGHQAGDQVLCAIATRLAAAIGSDDMVARLGGDEFAVLLGDISSATMGAKVQELRQAITKPIEVDGGSACVGVSIGIAACPDLPRDPALLVQQADAAMYRAKRGRLGQEFAKLPEAA